MWNHPRLPQKKAKPKGMPYAPIAVAKPICGLIFRSHLKIRILVQDPPLKSSGRKRRRRGSTRPVVYGISDTHTQVFRGVEIRTQHTDWSASPQAASSTGGLGPKDFFEIAYSHKPSVVHIRGVSFPVNTYPSVYACFFLTTQNRYKSSGFAI